MGGWNPWAELRGRSWLRLRWALLPAGCDGTWQGDTISLDARLGRQERNAALAHELVHEERRIGWPDATAATMEKEECFVTRETARRLVPLDELAKLVRRCESIDKPVGAAVVMDEFDVPVDVAHQALHLLAMQRGR